MTSTWRRSLLCLSAAAGSYLAYRAVARSMRRFVYRGRVVVVTGGSRGLGLLLARRLSQEGARLAICARDEEELTSSTGDPQLRKSDLYAATCDLTQPAQIHDFFAAVRSEMGPVDVLINNAGIIQVGPYETMTVEDYEQAMAIHFWAPLIAMHEVMPDMRRRGEGRIVNISSIGGKIGVPHLVPYCASKFALVGVSQGLRAELARDGIYVTTVCPGLMRTGSPRNALFKSQHRAEHAWFSISGSFPLLSMNADRAARQILDACRHGRAEIVLSLPAKLAVCTNALMPELTSDLLSLTAQALPGPGGIGTELRKGSQSASAWSPSWLTTLNEQAAQQNNELSTDDRHR